MTYDTDTPTMDPDTVTPDGTDIPAVTAVESGGVDSEPDDAVGAPSPERGPTMDPAVLDVAENVRKSFRLEDHPEVTDSIREHRVKSPIKVIRMPDGRHVVRDGQVRTLTALAFEQTEVPVWVTDFDPAVDATEAEIDRITEQITVNDRRIPLTDGDRAAGIAQMLDLGASITRVAKALQTKRDDIKRAGKIRASTTARGLVDEGQYDLEQAALIAEYDTLGDTDAVERLMRANRKPCPAAPGSSPIHLPEPVADLARTVAANRKGHATIGALTPSIWLFPGRPISTGHLTQRLRRLDIRPGAARSTALFQLATEIPAAILAQTLGIHTDVAVSWQRLSAGDWANFAAVSARTSTNAGET